MPVIEQKFGLGVINGESRKGQFTRSVFFPQPIHTGSGLFTDPGQISGILRMTVEVIADITAIIDNDMWFAACDGSQIGFVFLGCCIMPGVDMYPLLS